MPAGGGAGPNSSSLLSESSEGAFDGRSSRGAGGAAGPMTRAGLATGGGAGPASLSGEVDREAAYGGRVGPAVRGGDAVDGGRAGPATLRRLSLASGLGARSSPSSRLRLEGCGGIAGPIEGIADVCVSVVLEEVCLGSSDERSCTSLCGPRLPISELRLDGRHSRTAAIARRGLRYCSEQLVAIVPALFRYWT